MAEAFGIVAGAISVAAVFSTCIDRFDYVQAGRHLSRDLQTERLMLDCARYRLVTWGEAVNIYSDHLRSLNPQSSDGSLDLAKNVLFQILRLFENTKVITDCCQPIIPRVDSTAEPKWDINQIAANNKEYKLLTLKPRKEKGLLKKTTWAVYHRKEMKELVDGIKTLLDELERLTQVHDKRSRIVKQDVDEVLGGQELDLVAEAAGSVDPTLYSVIEHDTYTHRYTNI